MDSISRNLLPVNPYAGGLYDPVSSSLGKALPIPDCCFAGAAMIRSPRSSTASAAARIPGDSIPSSFVKRINGLSLLVEKVHTPLLILHLYVL